MQLRSGPTRQQRLRVCALFFIFASFFTTISGYSADPLPRDLIGVGIDDHTGQKINLDLQFENEEGHTVPLRTYFTSGKPVLFLLAYYECPSLCTFVFNAAVDSMKKLDWETGNQFEVVAVSFDPRDTSEKAKLKRQAYMDLYKKEKKLTHAPSGWHFLVGKPPQIAALTEQLGFKYKWNEEKKEFAHSSAAFVLTPNGKISRIFYGIDYPSRDLKVAMLEASEGKIGNLVDKILLFCFHYDGESKKYVLLASRLMTMAGAVTLVLLAAYLTTAWLKERHTNA